MKHFEMFYTEEDNYQPPGNNYAHVDLEIDHENINYLKMFPIYL
jgi:hypothetical protein